MRHSFEIHYKAEFNGNRDRFRERVELDFKDVSELEAPIAMQWPGAFSRWFEGRHYIDFNADIAKLADNYIDLRQGSADRKYTPKRYPETETSAERAAALIGADQFETDCIFVSGKAWLVCDEPKLWASPNGVRVEYRFPVSKRAADLRWNENGFSPEIASSSYRADDAEDAIAACGGGEVQNHMIFVHEPASITFDPVKSGLLSCSRALCEMFAETAFGDVNPHVAVRLAELRTCMWKKGDIDIDYDHLAELAANAVDAVRTHGRKRGLQWMDRIVERWSNRPIGTDLGYRVPPQHPRN